MAIIKCPECGHQISDKAPICPSCGIEIAGKVIRCPECGEVYLKEQGKCPKCKHTNDGKPLKARAMVLEDGDSKEPSVAAENPNPQKQHKRNRHITLKISLAIALLACGVCFYLYRNAREKEEIERYEYAMKSKDITVLETYLAQFGDAPKAHRDSILAHLNILKATDEEWVSASASRSKSVLKRYIDTHPESTHVADAKRMIDSIDWAFTVETKTIEAYKSYLEEHPYGEHVEEANNGIKEINTQTVTSEERDMISGVFRKFFQSINSKNNDGLLSTVNDVLTSFLGKEDASKSDVTTFMKKIYKEDITNMNFYILNDYKISKKEVGDEQYEYTVSFTTEQKIERTDPSQETYAKYRINAKVNPDGKIAQFNMTKLNE